MKRRNKQSFKRETPIVLFLSCFLLSVTSISSFSITNYRNIGHHLTISKSIGGRYSDKSIHNHIRQQSILYATTTNENVPTENDDTHNNIRKSKRRRLQKMKQNLTASIKEKKRVMKKVRLSSVIALSLFCKTCFGSKMSIPTTSIASSSIDDGVKNDHTTATSRVINTDSSSAISLRQNRLSRKTTSNSHIASLKQMSIIGGGQKNVQTENEVTSAFSDLLQFLKGGKADILILLCATVGFS